MQNSRLYIYLLTGIFCLLLNGCGGSSDHSENPAANKAPDGAGAAVETGLKMPDTVAERMNFSTEVVEERSLGEDLHITGHIAPSLGQESDVSTRFSGRVLDVRVKPGDIVRPGQILAMMDSHELSGMQAELIEAQSKLRIAEAHQEREKQIYEEYLHRPKGLTEARTRFEQSKVNLELAESDFKRMEGLHKEKIAAEKDYIAAHAVLARAKLDFKESQTAVQREEGLYKNRALLRRDLQLAEAETLRDRQHVQTLTQRLKMVGFDDYIIDEILAKGKIVLTLPIHSKVHGVITFQDLSVGELLSPDKHIFTITNMGTVHVVADLPEVDLKGIKIGSAVKVRVQSFPNELFTGKISYISDTVNPETRTVAMRAILDNKARKLKINMFADIELKAAPKTALAVPKSAVQDEAGHKVVFIKEGSEFKKRNVEVGADNEHYYEVISGIAAGESVVTQGSLMLKTEMARKH